VFFARSQGSLASTLNELITSRQLQANAVVKLTDYLLDRESIDGNKSDASWQACRRSVACLWYTTKRCLPALFRRLCRHVVVMAMAVIGRCDGVMGKPVSIFPVSFKLHSINFFFRC
jgi:hypothetical protein